MTTYDLEPRFDSRKSFYGKARVRIEGTHSILTSYSTDVARVIPGNDSSEDRAIVYGNYSATTSRHVKEFLLQMGFKAESTKQILTDYPEHLELDSEQLDSEKVVAE